MEGSVATNKSYNMPDVIPYTAQWDVTFACNFKCVFCLTSSGRPLPNELTTDQAIEMIDNFYDEGIWFLKILGGEPFFRKDMIKILHHAANKGMILSFSTNASLITEEKANALREIRNSIAYIQMSLYGYNEETYQKVTGDSRNFKRALNGLKLLCDKGLEVSVLTVATDDNADKIPAYFEIAKQYGAAEFRLTPEVSLGRAAEKDYKEIDSTPMIWKKLIDGLNTITSDSNQNDPEVIIDARPLPASYLHKLTGLSYFYENCTAATSMIYIDPTGEASPCPFLKQTPDDLKEKYSDITSSNIMNQSFHDIWNSESFDKFRSYYDPGKNLFEIKETCRYYKDGSCVPCVVTPCNCIELTRAVKNLVKSKKVSDHDELLIT